MGERKQDRQIWFDYYSKAVKHVEKIINEDIVNDAAMNQYIDSFEIDIASSDEDSS